MNTSPDPNSWPPALASALGSNASLKRIETGESGASVSAVEHSGAATGYLKIAPLAAQLRLDHDAAILRWLRGKLPAPEVLYAGSDQANEYLLMTAVPGIDLSADAALERPERLVQLLADGLRQIHAVPIQDCPFDQRLPAKLANARLRVQQGLIDTSDFDDERTGRTPESLLEELVKGMPETSAADLVFTHGDYCLPNILASFDLNRVTGFIDLGRAGVSDRYQDLALTRRSIVFNVGEEWVRPFFEAYGLHHPDETRLNYYQALDELF